MGYPMKLLLDDLPSLLAVPAAVGNRPPFLLPACGTPHSVRGFAPAPRKEGTGAVPPLRSLFALRNAALGYGPLPYMVGRVDCRWIESALLYEEVGQLNAKVRPRGDELDGREGRKGEILSAPFCAFNPSRRRIHHRKARTCVY